MFESILKSTDTSISMSSSLICVGVAIGLGILISICYMCTQKKGTYTKDFVITLSILPAVVAIVIMLVGSNIARAFSIAGAFALVRFRSIPGNSKEIAVVFFTMSIGLAAGLGFIGFAGIATLIIGFVFIVLSLTGFGDNRTEEKMLKITIPESLNYKDVFTEIFDANLKSYRVQNVKTTNMGSMYEIQYLVLMKKEADEKEFIDALRCRNGNLNISLGELPDKTGVML